MARKKKHTGAQFVEMSQQHPYELGPSARRTLPKGWRGTVPGEVATKIEAEGKGRVVGSEDDVVTQKAANATDEDEKSGKGGSGNAKTDPAKTKSGTDTGAKPGTKPAATGTATDPAAAAGAGTGAASAAAGNAGAGQGGAGDD